MTADWLEYTVQMIVFTNLVIATNAELQTIVLTMPGTNFANVKMLAQLYHKLSTWVMYKQ